MEKKRFTKKRGQAAMEFLSTYGCTILVVLIAIRALAYLGVFNLGGLAQSSCIIAPGIDCLDFTINEDSITITIKNSLGKSMILSDITVEGCTGSTSGTLIDGQQDTFTISGCSNKAKSKFKANVDITYSLGEEQISHTKIGEIIDAVTTGITGNYWVTTTQQDFDEGTYKFKHTNNKCSQ